MEEFANDNNIWAEDETITHIQKPRLYKVILLNDDYTTMDFVVYILERIFNKSPLEATAIMLNVHKNGRGVAGIYPKDIAETKINEVHQIARDNNYPLMCSLEPE
ncbi:MAG: ATP-dependent Clp protease adapter ClpS [Thermodesulfovibrionales bacterium]|nr:ATP-dependent Clp protease adapter ClpS [Thermodesulfovibrionales bacterium]